MTRIVFLLLCLGLPMQIFANNVRPPQVLQLTATQLQQMQVQWGRMQVQEHALSASYPAEVVLPPTQTRVVTASQAGLITMLTVSVGDTVKAGQVIGQLSSPDLVALQSQYLQAETQARLRAQALKRDRELFKDGIISQRRLQETQSADETSQAMLLEHQQTLKLAGMSEAGIDQLVQKRVLHHNIAITAPMSGQVMEQHQAVGARVDMATPVYTISRLAPVWLMIQVPVEQAQKLSLGQAVSLPKWGLQAKVETILKQLNKNNQTMTVRARLDQGSHQLSIGQIVDVAFAMRPAATSSQFVVVRDAVARQGTQAVVFVQSTQGVTVTPVQVITEQGQQLTIQGALRGDETIAIQGVAALKGHWLGLGKN